MKIEVTQEDINRGEQGSSTTCAIARAIRRQTGYRSVDVDGILEVGENCYQLPKKAHQFIDRFDENKKWVKPFSFTVKGLKAKTKAIWKKILSPIQPVKSPLQANAVKTAVTK